MTLNPSYSLRQDGNRVILHGVENERDHSQEWFSFIHPYYGMLLSFFTFENYNLNEKISRCCEYFGKGCDYIMEILSPLIDNSNIVHVKTKHGELNSFPKNLIVSSDIPIHRKEEYSPTDFYYDGIPDFQTNRLHFPISINLELIMRCYTDCCYCYSDRSDSKGDRLTTSRIIELIREAKSNRAIQFDINGGEVLLHPDIKIILKELKDSGFNPLISTKMPINNEMIDYIRKIGIEKIQISLDSADDKLLTKLVKTPVGYLHNIGKTLEYASNVGLQVDINTVLTKYNVSPSEVEHLLEYISSFKCVRHNRLNPVGYSLYKTNFSEIAPTKENLDLVESLIPEWKVKYGININLSYFECASQFEKNVKIEKFRNRAICTGNVWNMVILPNGDVTICEELYYKSKFIIGNVKCNSINEVWNSRRAIDLYNMTVPAKSSSVCGLCDDFNKCRMNQGVCWKTILMAYGDENWDFPDPRCPKAPFPYNCFYY